ncbi:MAG: DNA helicase RecQ [Oscillospiraceae bacterium]
MDKLSVLKQYFGYDSFRGGQQSLIDEIIAGRDVVGIMPTGAGKSLCYQIPALVLGGVTIVVSPLISLMKDQVSALCQAGVSAAFLNSSLNERQYPRALANMKSGMYKIVYVAPERLLSSQFMEACSGLDISLVAIDEAHCISRWGQDFRPSYTQIPEFINSFDKRPIIAAFTATATPEVKDDIITQLKLEKYFELVTGFDRPNLFFEVRRPENKTDELLKIVKKNKSQCGIVYCMTRKAVDEVCEKLCASGCRATRYHAGLSSEERRINQDKFLYDECEVVVATNAFGMGIDKSNVRYVVHYNMPMDIESYYQEAGRAGRDGLPSECILLYRAMDIQTAKFIIGKSRESAKETDPQAEQARIARAYGRLNEMIGFCNTTECLRGYILKYFGEVSAEVCDNCSSCKQGSERIDITEDALLMFRCVKNTGERLGLNTIAAVLKGSKTAQLERMGLTRCADFAAASSRPAAQLQAELRWLVTEGLLMQSNGEYPVISLTEKASAALVSQDRIIMKRLKKNEELKQNPYSDMSEVESELFEQLRALRSRIALAQHVPAFVVFSDASLRDMCAIRPSSIDQFMMVNGVGLKKQEAYGSKFLKLIREFQGREDR